jgi:hypothetical protein
MTTWGACLHWSYATKAWLGFCESLPGGRMIVRHEMTFIRTAPEDAAVAIVKRARALEIPLAGVLAQPELFPKDKHYGGEKISQTFARHGVMLRPADDDAINGWSRLRSWLQLRDGEPAMTIHRDCAYLLRTLPMIIADEKNPDDIADTPDANPVKALRYYVMSRPLPWQPDPALKPGPGTWGHALRHLFDPQSKPREFVGDDLYEK